MSSIVAPRMEHAASRSEVRDNAALLAERDGLAVLASPEQAARTRTSVPSLARRATQPPHPMVSSSGCGASTNTRSAKGRVNTGPRPAADRKARREDQTAGGTTGRSRSRTAVRTDNDARRAQIRPVRRGVSLVIIAVPLPESTRGRARGQRLSRHRSEQYSRTATIGISLFPC